MSYTSVCNNSGVSQAIIKLITPFTWSDTHSLPHSLSLSLSLSHGLIYAECRQVLNPPIDPPT